MPVALHINLYLCLAASLFALCTTLVLTLFLTDLSLKYNICSSPGDWLISRGLGTTIHFCTGSQTQDALFSACSWDPRLPVVFSETLWHHQDSLQQLLCVPLLKGNPEGHFITIIIITILHRGCQRGVITAMPVSRAPRALAVHLTATAAGAQNPPNQPAAPQMWLQQIKGAFHDCDSLLEEAVCCWIFSDGV